MKRHGKLQVEYVRKYKDKGYKVETEASINYLNGFYIVDILATKMNKRIAVELGFCNPSKLKHLKKLVDEVVYIPYLEVSKDGFFKHNLCGYVWKPRVKKPKECPKCKGRIDRS